MIDKPRILETKSTVTAVIRLTIPRPEIKNVMGPAVAEVLRVVAEQGIGPAGPVFSYHYKSVPDAFDFEVGVPVTRVVEPSGRVIPSRLPGVLAASTTYHGSYEGLESGWQELMKWIGTAGHTTRPDFWESYVSGPESTSNPAEWRTELVRPVVERRRADRDKK
jgi:effector-binding domain-containing protein